MNWKLNIYLIGVVLMIISAFMLLPTGVSYYYNGDDLYSLSISMLLTFITGLIAFIFTKKDRTKELKHRDGFFVVTISWLCVAYFGSIPYLLSNTFGTP